MPNWCNNVVELAHEDPAMIIRARDAFNRGELLQEFVPVPPELKDTIAGCAGSNETYAQQLLDFKEQLNVKFFGYKNWYDYCVGAWGTKWDIGLDGSYGEAVEIQEDGRLTLSFDSAWSPPTEAYDKLLVLGFQVRAYYYESGMCFAGLYDDGHDDYYEFGDMTSDEVEDELPAALNDMFGISEGMVEYEAENKEPEELSEWYKDGVEKKGLELKSE